MVLSNLKQKRKNVWISTKQSTRHFLVVGFLKKEWTNFSTKWFLFNFVARVQNEVEEHSKQNAVLLLPVSGCRLCCSIGCFSTYCFSQQIRPFFSFPFESRNLNSLTSRIWMLSISDIQFPQRRTNFAN